ncbi:MAG: dTDP-4-dehydrorhamnose reductase [Christensenellales bacterium]|jgi:dTDP-4-dehydrorhamnose reductase
MKALVTGAGGLLGGHCVRELRARGAQVIAMDRAALDVANEEAVREALFAHRPDCVLHLAAWTAVDDAEDLGNIPAVRAVNEMGTSYVARACREIGAKLLYTSTDYVFDGSGDKPWSPDDPADRPLNVYGASKRAGERAVIEQWERSFIVRIAWLYGAGGRHFVDAMLALGKTRAEVSVVDDQFGTPTYAPDLARLLCEMLAGERYGIYHAANAGGFVSRYEFAREIFRLANLPVRVLPVSSDAFPAKAARPNNGRLDLSKLAASGFAPLPHWRDALARYLQSIGMREHGRH